MLRFDEPHRRRVKHNIEARISAPERRTIRCRWSDECYRKTLLPCKCNEAGCQITACNDGQAQTAEPSQAAQHAAVAKHTPRPLVERLHGSRILEQSNHVVHVRCDHILKASPRLSQNIANCFLNRSSIKTRPEEIDAFSPRHGASRNTLHFILYQAAETLTHRRH